MSIKNFQWTWNRRTISASAGNRIQPPARWANIGDFTIFLPNKILVMARSDIWEHWNWIIYFQRIAKCMKIFYSVNICLHLKFRHFPLFKKCVRIYIKNKHFWDVSAPIKIRTIVIKIYIMLIIVILIITESSLKVVNFNAAFPNLWVVTR